MNIVIFEGCDGSGKTTLADAWERRAAARGQSVRRSNHGPYLGEKVVTHHYASDFIRYERNTLLLIDRCWISESIYGPLMRSEDRIPAHDRKVLENLARRAGAILVVCQPPFDECAKAWASRRNLEYLPSESKLRQVYDGFCDVLSDASVPLPTYHYDWTREAHRGTFIEMIEETAGDSLCTG